MMTVEFDEAAYLANQVEEARQRAVLASADAEQAKLDAQAAEYAAREATSRSADVIRQATQAVSDAQAAAAQAQAPTDEMVASLAKNPASLTRDGIDKATGAMIIADGSATQSAGDARWVTQADADTLVASEIERPGSETQVSGDNRWVTNEGVDSKTANLIAQPDTSTNAALSAAIGDQATELVDLKSPAIRPVSAQTAPALLGLGDSLTNAWGNTDPYMKYTVEALANGWSYANLGYAGQTPDQIAARQGGRPALLTFPSNIIPASGSATVTADVNPVTGTYNSARPGTVAGVHGMLKYDGSAITFTRDDSGAPVNLGGPVKIIMDEGQAYRDWMTVIWAGRNGTDDAVNLDRIRAMVRYLGAAGQRWLILQVPPGSGWPDKTALNRAIAQEWPENYVPVADFLRTQAAAEAAGITFTSQDNTDIANGLVPASFRSDSLHHNSAGRKAVGVFVALEIKRRGWHKADGDPVKPRTITRAYSAAQLTVGTNVSVWKSETGGASLTALSGAEPDVVTDSGYNVVELSASSDLMTTPDLEATYVSFGIVVRATTLSQLSTYFAGVYGLSITMDGLKQWQLTGAASAPSTTLVDLNWHTLVAVRNAGIVSLFLDGVQIVTATTGHSAVTVARVGGGGQAAKARIADFTQWKRTLTDKEVSDYHAAMKADFQALGLV